MYENNPNVEELTIARNDGKYIVGLKFILQNPDGSLRTLTYNLYHDDLLKKYAEFKSKNPSGLPGYFFKKVVFQLLNNYKDHDLLRDTLISYLCSFETFPIALLQFPSVSFGCFITIFPDDESRTELLYVDKEYWGKLSMRFDYDFGIVSKRIV